MLDGKATKMKSLVGEKMLDLPTTTTSTILEATTFQHDKLSKMDDTLI